MASSQIRVERVGPEQGVLVVTLDRPGTANAYTQAMLLTLREALEDVHRDERVRAAVITGSGNVFCAGADLQELNARGEREALQLLSRDVFELWARAPLPTIAAVNGPAIGGGFELALACDIRICTRASRFELPESRLGLMPAAGGIRRLIAQVGASRAKEVTLFGKSLDAGTAASWGLVSSVDEEPLAAALRLALSSFERDPMALAAAKLLAFDQLKEGSGLGAEAITQALLYARRNGSRST